MHICCKAAVFYRSTCQDMLDVEYYSSVFKTQHGGLLFSKYRDRIPQDIIYTYGKDVLDLGVIGERCIAMFLTKSLMTN